MSHSSLPAVTSIVYDGEQALLAGDTFAARTRFRAAVEQDPACATAWLGLSRVTPMLRERHQYLTKAVTLAPELIDARADLLDVEHLLAQGIQVQTTTPKRAVEQPNHHPAPSQTSTAASTDDIVFCAKHPTRETALHCISCMVPICGQCARSAPVGHLCQACLRLRRPINYQVQVIHLLFGALTATLCSFILAALLSLVPLGFYGFYIAMAVAPFAGGGIVMIIDRLTRGKRGRAMQLTVGGATIVGMLPAVFVGRFLLLLLQAGFAGTMVSAALEEQGMSIWSFMLSGIDPGVLCLMVLTAISVMYRLR